MQWQNPHACRKLGRLVRRRRYPSASWRVVVRCVPNVRIRYSSFILLSPGSQRVHSAALRRLFWASLHSGADLLASRIFGSWGPLVLYQLPRLHVCSTCSFPPAVRLAVLQFHPIDTNQHHCITLHFTVTWKLSERCSVTEHPLDTIQQVFFCKFA